MWWVGAVFLKFLRTGKEHFDRLKWPIYLKLTVAGLGRWPVAAVGFPGVFGNGYFVTNSILQGDYDKEMHESDAATQRIVFRQTAGHGHHGRRGHGWWRVHPHTVFRRSGRRDIWHHVASPRLGSGRACGRICAGGHGRRPGRDDALALFAIIWRLKFRSNYTLMPPLMLACVVATLVASQLHDESVYTEHMRLKGLSSGAKSNKPARRRTNPSAISCVRPCHP